MRDAETKNRFIELRASGKSYSEIGKELHIAKATCCTWNKELASEISRLKEEELDEIYTAYGMKKAARIKRIGETLNQIDHALEFADLSMMPPEKLLDYKLKYMEALGNEYIGDSPLFDFTKADPTDMLKYLGDLLGRVRSGEASKEQASRECAVLGSFLKAYEHNELKTRLDNLDAVLEVRK